jgi:hypothetical protein
MGKEGISPWSAPTFLLLKAVYSFSHFQICIFGNNDLEPGTGGYTCNPNYSGGRDQEDHCSRPAQANSS